MPGESLRFSWLGIAIALAFTVGLALPIAARAQVAVFDPGDYGSADLRMPESTSDAAAFIAAQQGAFEPIHELPEDDVIRRRAAPIGRLDLLIEDGAGRRALNTCTGTVLPGGWVLTNHHCIPADGERKLVAASILLGYLVAGGEGAERYALSTSPDDWHQLLDYSLVRLAETPDPRFGTLTFHGSTAEPGEPLLIIHHPLGRPKVMTRFRCFAAREQPDEVTLRHRCDTLPGSSGSLLFTRDLEPVAIHHSGGMMPEDDRSFNQGTRITAILAQSRILGEIAGAVTDDAPPQPGTAPAGDASRETAGPRNGPTAAEINDLLRRQQVR